MLRIIILGLILTGCKSAQQPIRYYWERPSKDFAERRHSRLREPMKSPHFVPVRGDQVSNELVLKYNYLYNVRRYGLYKKGKR